MSGLNDFLRHMARTIGAGVGVPYELLTGDLSSVNYSSAKLGLEAFKRRCLAIRASLLGTRLLDPVWKRFATLEVLSGRLSAPDFGRDPETYFAATWMWPGWPALDPYREAAADVVLMRAGVRSRDEVVSSRGRDVAEVTAEIETDPLREMIATASPRLGGMSGGLRHESDLA
jgi:capsid protein